MKTYRTFHSKSSYKDTEDHNIDLMIFKWFESQFNEMKMLRVVALKDLMCIKRHDDHIHVIGSSVS